jgi:hypothetical protein
MTMKDIRSIVLIKRNTYLSVTLERKVWPVSSIVERARMADCWAAGYSSFMTACRRMEGVNCWVGWLRKRDQKAKRGLGKCYKGAVRGGSGQIIDHGTWEEQGGCLHKKGHTLARAERQEKAFCLQRSWSRMGRREGSAWAWIAPSEYSESETHHDAWVEEEDLE